MNTARRRSSAKDVLEARDEALLALLDGLLGEPSFRELAVDVIDRHLKEAMMVEDPDRRTLILEELLKPRAPKGRDELAKTSYLDRFQRGYKRKEFTHLLSRLTKHVFERSIKGEGEATIELVGGNVPSDEAASREIVERVLGPGSEVSLSDVERELVRAELDGRTVVEVAEMRGMKATSAYKKKQRALEKLQKCSSIARLLAEACAT